MNPSEPEDNRRETNEPVRHPGWETTGDNSRETKGDK